MTLKPRFERVRRTERLARSTARAFQGMVRSGKLISIDADGDSTVEIQGRFGTARINSLSALTDSPNGLVGLKVA